MSAPCAAASWQSRRCTAWYAAASYSPRAIPDWLLTVTTRKPAALSRRIASPAPGSRRARPGWCRNPGSSRIVPSRSRKTALAIERGPYRPDEDVELPGKDRAGVEHHTVVLDAGHDGWVLSPQPGRHIVSR